MSKKAFDGIMAGVADAAAYLEGDLRRGVVHRIETPDVRAIRQKLGLTQPQFAARFGVSLATLRKWEQHQRQPAGAASVLLHVIEREPEAVLRALKAA